MIIYVDENMPPVFAEGFDNLQAPLSLKLGLESPVAVRSIKLVFGSGVLDEVWIPKLSGQGACIITQDYNIQRIKHQRQLCEQYELGMFYFRPPSKKGLSYWDMVRLVVKHWPEILDKASRENRPFAYKISLRSSRLEKM